MLREACAYVAHKARMPMPMGHHWRLAVQPKRATLRRVIPRLQWRQWWWHSWMQGALRCDAGLHRSGTAFAAAFASKWGPRSTTAFAINAASGCRSSIFQAAATFFLPLGNLLLNLGVVDDHITRFGPLSLQMPNVATRVWQHHEAFARGAQSQLSICFAHELHEAEAPRLPRGFVDDEVHPLDLAELRELSLDVCLGGLPWEVRNEECLPTPHRLPDVNGKILGRMVVDHVLRSFRGSSLTAASNGGVVVSRSASGIGLSHATAAAWPRLKHVDGVSAGDTMVNM
mmetsp:Transcript_88067/g.247566  ORF Transcript_88067/g.247566 Transcript_88067/m.247566 type:complete len:286 (-) Transcript_88067:57-914(-)